MKQWLLLFIFLSISLFSFCQLQADAIRSDFVLEQRRIHFDDYMRNKTINETFTSPLDSNTEDSYQSACTAVTQFLIQSPEVEQGFTKLFQQYDSLQYGTKRIFLEAVYALYPGKYEAQIKQLILKETQPKLFAMQALYLYRQNASPVLVNGLQRLIQHSFQANDTLPLLLELKKYLLVHQLSIKQATPSIVNLFQHQKYLQQKIIYSFQRWNRDYPGLAIIQNADGSFAKDSSGKLVIIEQLARSASGLPYFITDGNTPQGIYSIQGTAVAHNNIIGPTPNIQMVMPFEADTIYWQTGYDVTVDALTNYTNLLPENWQNYPPITEAFYAGKLGRTEIIAHGTTIDPAYFKDKSFYPLTPTMGCLCAKEIWNSTSGKFSHSEQYRLVNSFLSTPGDMGYLFVINVDDQQKAVAKTEVEQWVKVFENK